MTTKNLIKGQEYFFFLRDRHMTGFVTEITKEAIRIERGHYFTTIEGEPLGVCPKIAIKLNDLVAFVST